MRRPMQRVQWDALWPSSNWDRLPRGRWATLRQSPTSFLSLRARGTNDTFRLYLGLPFPLDPDVEYEVQGRGYPTDFLQTVSGNLSVATRKRTLEVIVSEDPVPGGSWRLHLECTVSGAVAGSVQLARVSCEGASAVFAQCRQTGADGDTFQAMSLEDFYTTNPVVAPNGSPAITQLLAGASNAGVSLGFGKNHTPIYNAATYSHTLMNETFAILLATAFSGGSSPMVQVSGIMER